MSDGIKRLLSLSPYQQTVSDRIQLNEPYALFVYAIKSPHTRAKYISRLRRFFDFVGVEGSLLEEQCSNFLKLVNGTRKEDAVATTYILHFLHTLKQQVDDKHIVATTIWNYVAAIKLFTEMNDIHIQWKKLLRGLPRGKSWSRDRAPTLEELERLCEYPDRRIKPIVYAMTSGGFRLGAWEYLRWGDIVPVKDGQAARMRVYAGEDEEYFTYISGEAYQEFKKWMDFRAMSGENVTNDSWLMRTLWDAKGGRSISSVNKPRKLTISGLKTLIQSAVHVQGLHTGLEPGKKRYEFKAIHGFRKYFKTHAEQVMKPINVEILMSHSVGISDSYYRPREQDLLEDYLKAAPLLTIENQRLESSAADKIRDEKIENLEKLVKSLIKSGQMQEI